MFVRADLYQKFGGFDEDFFAHMEEIDFCWRLKNGGYKIMFCPDSIVYHVGGGTLPKKSSQKTYLNFRNNISLLYKNLPSHLLFQVFAVRFPLDAIAAFKFLVDGGFGDFYAVLRAHVYFYSHFRQLRRKRKMLTNSMVHGIYKGNLVKEYFVNKKTLFKELNPEDFVE
jgi:GT2 family glycosyltransferase